MIRNVYIVPKLNRRAARMALKSNPNLPSLCGAIHALSQRCEHCRVQLTVAPHDQTTPSTTSTRRSIN